MKEAGAVLDGGSGVSCESEKLAANLGAQFDGTQVVSTVRNSGSEAKVADGREMPIQKQTRLAHMTVLTPCGHPLR